MRIYCGLATDGRASWAAIVDDTGRAVAVSALDEFGPQAFSALSRLLATFGASHCTPIAVDDDDALVPQLCTAVGHPIASIGEKDIDAFMRDDPAARQPGGQRALAAARCVQTGAVTAGAGAPPRNVAKLRGLLSSVCSLTAGRATSVEALRGVLRELYPAALRAFDDPGDARPLAVLAALPEPAAAAYCNEDEVTKILATQGLPDAAGQETVAIIALLRTAAAENAPSRRTTDEATRTAVRAAVSAVRAYDEGLSALVSTIGDRLKLRSRAGGAQAQARTATLPQITPEGPKRAAPEPIPHQRAAEPEHRRSAKVTAIPTRRREREPDKSSSGGFPMMPEPPVFQEPPPSPVPAAHNEPETVPMSLKEAPAPAKKKRGSASAEAPPQPPVRTSVPEIDAGDNEGLAIFAQAKSAWFTGVEEGETVSLDWSTRTDEAWRTAQQAGTPAVGEQTSSGLPRRVPQANLVPGSALPEETGPVAIERDPQMIAANTAGYFRGWNRARRDTVDAAPVGAGGR